MSSTRTVAKNSLWLVLQPLLLNFISIAATAYIARTLGKVDYGKFIFAFSFVAMFMPLVNMGLRAITVREVAKDRSCAAEYTKKMLASRLGLSIVVVILIVLSINMMGVEARTKIIVYLASLTIISTSIWTTLIDVFQAFEKMSYVAYSQFYGGFILTVLSVLVLFMGFGLSGLTLAYVLGNIITMGVAWLYISKLIGRPTFEFDWQFIKNNLAKGAPFFYPSIVALAGMKIGIILLSIFSGDASVGVFGAANNLVEKLIIIPDGICTAMFPTLIILYQQSPQKAAHLFRKYFEYLLIIALPIAVGTTMLAKPIILLIYGPNYIAAVPVLQILVWWLFFQFLLSMQGSTLGAIHQERKAALVSFVVAPIYIVLNLLLIPMFQERGTAWANLVSAIFSFMLLSYYIKVHFVQDIIPVHRIMRIVGAVFMMGLSIYWFIDEIIIFPLVIGFLSYITVVVVFGVVSWRELQQLKSILMKRIGFSSPEILYEVRDKRDG